MKRLVSILIVGLLCGSSVALAQTGSVVDEQKVSDSFGNFSGGLNDSDRFGSALAFPGDLDGDGIPDLYVGMPGGDRGGLNSGAIWAVYMNPDGTAKGQFRINEGRGGFEGRLDYTDAFGSSIACLGDVDGDGVGDLVVGVPSDDGGPFSCAGLVLSCNYGGYWILYMNEDGTVRDETPNKLDANFGSGLERFSESGASLAPLGDLNNDGVPDHAMGAPGIGNGSGALWIIFNNANGTPGIKLRITGGQFGFDAVLGTARFGSSVANIGDLDGDGVVDLAVGAPTDSAQNRGAVYILFLNDDGTVKDHQKINASEGGFDGALANGDRFGSSVANMGDLDGNGVTDLAVGAALSDIGGDAAGAAWLLFMNSDGTVADELLIAEGNGGLDANIRSDERFGAAVTPIGDLNGDGLVDLVVGASRNDDGAGEVGEARGALYVLFLDGMVNIDFENGENGQQVGGGAALSAVMSIEGFPSSGLTAALFDSDPGGPNELSADPDLLVDSGNVLILQGVAGQTVPGIYDEPNDDRSGGLFVIDFGAAEVAPLSIDLIDICPSPGQDATVTLFDDAGRTRTYSVPSGWTEDVQMDGPPGIRTLDLTTLSDQPGFVAVATASQEAGYDGNAVVLIEVALSGSAAIDNLSYDPSPDAPAFLHDGSQTRRRQSFSGKSAQRSLR